MGNTKAVDLGYLDATYMTLVNGAVRTSHTPTLQAYMTNIKQRMIDAGLNDGVNWSLSRIAFHAGTTSALYNGGMFIYVIRHLVAGVPSGDEWMIALPGPGTTQFTGLNWSLGSSLVDVTAYFYNAALSYASTNVAGGFWFDYNPDGVTDSWDVGAGADFDAPASSPKTSLAAFMPATTKPKGLVGPALTITNENNLIVVFNHTAKFLGLVFGDLGNPRGYVYAGRIINPKRSGDVHDTGLVYGGVGQTLLATNTVIEALTDLGVQISCTPLSHSLFLAGNQPYFDGSVYRYHRDAAIIRTSAYIKGELKPDMFPIQGPTSRHHLSMYQSEHGRALKVCDNMCIPWADDVPPPFSGWPLSPQVPTIG